MNDTTPRALLVAGLSANVLLLVLTLLDHALNRSGYMWPLFSAWALLILLLVLLAVWAMGPAREAVVRFVEQPAAKPAPAPAPAPLPAPAAAPAAPAGPFTFQGYTLYSRDVALASGGRRTIWFFSKRSPASGTPSPKPAGYHVGVNERTGLPFLKKGGGPDGEDLTPRPEPALRPQCAALTDEGRQCRNSARADSKYCASHFGYQPPAMAKAEAARKDTRGRVRGAPDTLPSVRRRPA